MSTNSHPPKTQSGFFNDLGELGGNHAQFSEVCTALYERELLFIAHSGISNASILKRRIGGLPHHIRSVARYFVNNPTPLSTDTYNGSWYAKQPKQFPKIPEDLSSTKKWFEKHADYGLVVPVMVKTIEGVYIELDSVDKTLPSNNTIHLNKHGWFNMDGTSLQNEDAANDGENFDSTMLLKPTKSIMASACAGHAWNYKSRISPRALTIREMRLSTQIQWKDFTLLRT